VKVGRNDPCPCGSGRKYKHCHLNAEGEVAPAHAPWERNQELSQRLPSNLLRFATSRWGQEVVDEAWSEFTLFEEQAFDRVSVHLPVFLPWFFYEWEPDPQNTSMPPGDLDAFPVVSAYLAGRGRHEDSLAVHYLEACRSSSFSFLDLLEVSPGSGFAVKDALTHWQGFVTERSASRTVQKGDILFARVVTHDGLSVLDGCSPVAFPPLEKPAIIELRNRILQANPTITVEVLKEYGLEMLEVYHTVAERLLHPRPPELANTDGEPIAFCRVTYDVPFPRAAFDALRHLSPAGAEADLLADAVFDESGELEAVEIPWLRAGPGMPVSLGTIRIEGGRLIVEVNSEERARRFREIADAALPAGSRHVATVVEPVEAALEAHRREHPAPSPPDDLNQLPEVQAVLKEHLRTHYREWPDMTLPALRGKTPRQAMKTRDGREMVEALLLGLEQRVGRQPGLDNEILAELRASLGAG
jgi:hypothetical protein